MIKQVLHKQVESQNIKITKLKEGKESVEKLLEGARPSHEGNRHLEHELKTKIRGLEERNTKLLNENGKLQKENGELKNETSKLRNKNQELRDEITNLELASRKKPVQVYMYAPSMNERISTAVRSELKEILTQHLGAIKDRKLDIMSTHDAKMVPVHKPLIVLCINASRLGTDVEQALQNVTCSRSVVVAVIHHKEIHALPPQASEKLLYGDKFRDLRAIVDIAFLTTRGMYACDMNNRALERLTDFICDFDT
ncbi:uncharacterized protein LOC125652271 isoform X4 [Ostrea edulis]|uniref:uncharacterized protein LOC125652271 isoform X4 n=1 Tax=Ostrea edulis TaxID=37623 RepID=UPI0024AFB02A|nr:uncharacterized protein LOC125652271 isoform X4 [Ostrea edulis]